MLSKSRKIKEKVGLGELGLVVVDYIQMMDSPNKESRDKELSKIMVELKKMAKALDVPIVLMSQLSRDVERRENHRPMLCDLRDSEGFENHSDVVIMLYRDEYYHPETEDRGIAELIVTSISAPATPHSVIYAWTPEPSPPLISLNSPPGNNSKKSSP